MPYCSEAFSTEGNQEDSVKVLSAEEVQEADSEGSEEAHSEAEEHPDPGRISVFHRSEGRKTDSEIY